MCFRGDVLHLRQIDSQVVMWQNISQYTESSILSKVLKEWGSNFNRIKRISVISCRVMSCAVLHSTRNTSVVLSKQFSLTDTNDIAAHIVNWNYFLVKKELLF